MFTRILLGPSSQAVWNIAECNAPFDAVYAVCCAAPDEVRKVCEPMITREPPRSLIASAAAPSTCIVPTTFVERTRCQSSSLVRAIPPMTSCAATCTTPSTVPNRETASEISA